MNGRDRDQHGIFEAQHFFQMELRFRCETRHMVQPNDDITEEKAHGSLSICLLAAIPDQCLQESPTG